MLFVDGIVLVDETKERINAKLERSRRELESQDFKLILSKIEYIDCSFGINKIIKRL